MAQAKEQSQSILEENYGSVQSKELDLNDQAAKRIKDLGQATSKIEKTYKDDLKQVDQQEKEEKTAYKGRIKDAQDEHKQTLADITAKKEAAEAEYQTALNEHQEAYQKAVDEVKAALAEQKSTLDAALKDMAKQHDKEAKATAKRVAAIKDKGVKDQGTFDTRLTDLRTKYDQNIVALNEKEQVKIEKLTAAASQKVIDLEAKLKSLEEAFTKKQGTFQLVYEEELAEIDEKIAGEQDEFEQKHQNIKDSTEKRIAVREKHMQRAIQDNDQRSAKQHKKDIAKFRKEADRDLALLEKNYKQQKAQSADYRMNFIKEHFQQVAQQEIEQAGKLEDKRIEIQTVKATLEHDIANTKLEYEQLRAEELQKFNKDYAQIREKQETVRHQQDKDVAAEQHAQAVREVEYERDKAIAKEEHNLFTENKEKDLRVLAINLQNGKDIALNTKDEAHRRLEFETGVADIKLTRDLAVLEREHEIVLHKLQDKRHQLLNPRQVEAVNAQRPNVFPRGKDRHDLAVLEISNRTKLRLAELEAEQKRLESEHIDRVKHIDTVFTAEAAYYETNVATLAGDLSKELDAFIAEQEGMLADKREAIEKIESRRDRKTLEQEYETAEQNYHDKRAEMEQQLSDKVGAYRDALTKIEARKAAAIAAETAFHQAAIDQINKSRDLIVNHRDAELASAKQTFENLEANLQKLETAAANQAQNRNSDLASYLQRQIDQENKRINTIKTRFEGSRETLSNVLQQALSDNAVKRQELLEAAAEQRKSEEQRLEDVRVKTEQQVETIREDAATRIAEANDEHSTATNTIAAALNAELSQIQGSLANQTSEYSKLLADITDRIGKAKEQLDEAVKRIRKESADHLKEQTVAINSKAEQATADAL